MLARDVLAAAHQRFALVLRDRADEAQLEAFNAAGIGFNAAGDGRGVDLLQQVLTLQRSGLTGYSVLDCAIKHRPCPSLDQPAAVPLVASPLSHTGAASDRVSTKSYSAV